MTETGPSGHRTIFELFAEVKRQVGPVGKDSRNKDQNFSYRGVDAVVNAAADALDSYGVIISPHLDKLTYGTVEVGKNRTPMAHAQVEVTYTAYGPGGDSFPMATVPGEAMDSGDKATAKAMSVAFRIALLQALNLPTGDPDPDSQTYERSSGANSAGDAFDQAGRQQDGGRPWSPRQPQQPAASTSGPAAHPAGSQAEGDFVLKFYADLADAKDDAAHVALTARVGTAIRSREILAATGNDLIAAVRKHKAETRGAA